MKCNAMILEGDDVVYYPNERKAYCKICGAVKIIAKTSTQPHSTEHGATKLINSIRIARLIGALQETLPVLEALATASLDVSAVNLTDDDIDGALVSVQCALEQEGTK